MKKLVGALMIAVLATGVVAANLWLDLRAERGKARELATRVSAAESMQLARIAEPPAAPALPAEVAKASPPVAQPAKKSDKASAASPHSGVLEAMTTPAGQDAARGMMSAMMAQLYPDIERELGLTAQEKQSLFDLLASEGLDSAGMILGTSKDPAARREMQRRIVEAERAQEAKVSALLGSKYPKWEEYQTTSAARQQVDQLRRVLGASGSPLSELQSEQLVMAFATETKRAKRELDQWSASPAAIESPDMMRETMQRAVDTQLRMVGVAEPILDAAQLAHYKRQVEQQATMLRATMGMMGSGGAP